MIKAVRSEPNPVATPPRPLGIAGESLWQTVHREYHVGDAGGFEMLAQACTMLDRAEDLRAHIERDGVIIYTKTGPRDHPGIKHEIAARAFVVRTLQRLGLDVEAIKPVGRPSGYA